MKQFSRVASGLGVAALLSYGSSALALPEGYAEAALNLSDLIILQGDGMAGVNSGNSVLPNISIQLVDSNGGSEADLNDAGAPAGESQTITGQPAGTAFAIYTESGPNASGYVPNQHYAAGTYAGTTFAGGTSSTYGNLLIEATTTYAPAVLAPGSDTFDTNDVSVVGADNVYAGGSSACAATNVGDCVFVQSQVNLVSNATGTADADQGVQVLFVAAVLNADWFELSFIAEGFLRTELEQLLLSADAGYNWSVEITDATGSVFRWEPDGSTSGSGLSGACLGTTNSGATQDCFEFADAFDMNDSIGVLGGPQLKEVDNLAGGAFEVELWLEPGLYTFQIEHTTDVNAAVFFVPEPGTLTLLGLGMLGVGAARRKKVS